MPSTAVIAGAVCGSAIPILLLLALLARWCCRRRRQAAAVQTGSIRITLKDLSADEIMAKFDVNKDGVLDMKEMNDLMDKIVVRSPGSLERQTTNATDLHISVK